MTSTRCFADPQRAGELGLVTVHLLDEAVGVLAPDEHVDRLVEWVVVGTASIAGPPAPKPLPMIELDLAPAARVHYVDGELVRR